MRKVSLFGLSLLGLFDAAYLWWVYTSPSHPMLCLGTGCDVVRVSSYANLWGHPLPAYGAAMYAALALGVLAQAVFPARLERSLRFAAAGISGAGLLASLYLTGIEASVLHAWCAWCVVSALTVTLIFALSLLDLARPATPVFLVIRRGERYVELRAVWTYLAVFAIAVLLGAPAFLFLSRHGELPPAPPLPDQVLNERLVRPDSHATGNLRSPVTVVEFVDFECPVCGGAEPVVEEIRRTYGSQVRFVFRQFPMPQLHAYAEAAAEASECAAEQGKFWEAVKKFYQEQNDLSEPALKRYAAEMGLDRNRFSQCLSSGSMVGRVRRDLDDGHALGVHGTPTFFVGRRMIVGPQEFAKFAQVIDHELSQPSAAAAASGPAPGSSPATNLPQTKPLSTASTQTGDSSSAPGLLARNGGIFSQFQKPGLTCSEDDAKQQQPTLIRTPEALQLFQGEPKALFVDVRSPKEFAGGRIRGALNVPVDEIEQRWNQLPQDSPIVFYESGSSPGDVCASGRAAGRILLGHGFASKQVKVYQDGLVAWEKQGLPVER
jgi:protein-disulfide isomerase/rhodanese-related sulfurtransferase/uncharacterized membrane protein